MSSRIQELDAIVRQFDLNQHPFYQDWRAGTLPVQRLAEYADEWAPFIAVLETVVEQHHDRIPPGPRKRQVREPIPVEIRRHERAGRTVGWKVVPEIKGRRLRVDARHVPAERENQQDYATESLHGVVPLCLVG